MSNSTPTIDSTKHTMPVAGSGAVDGAPASSNAVTRLHAELDGIVQRPVSDTACREAMLDCLIRCRSLVGGVWFLVQGTEATADVVRLQGTMLERQDVQRWLANLAVRSFSEQTDIVANCPAVRNLKAICVPAEADRRGTQREPTSSGFVEFPPRVLVGIMTATEEKDEAAELLAGQCVVRAWRDWHARLMIRQSGDQLSASSVLIDLTRRMSRENTVKGSCQLLTNALQKHFDARFVAVGLKKRRHRKAVRLTSVSGIGDFDPNAQQVGRLESALNEAIIRDSLTSFPIPNEEQRHQHLAHKRLAETFGVDCCVSIPLPDHDGEVIGAMTLGGSASRLLDGGTTDLLQAARLPIGASVSVAQTIEGSWLRRAARRICGTLRSWRGVATFACVAGLATASLIPVPYRIACRCTAEPVNRRYCLAPYDGMLENTFVEPGDNVVAGELLARMEGRELGLELAGLTADSHRAGKERDVNRAELQIAKSLMSEMELEKLTAQQRLVRHRLNNLELRSPVDGVVIGGSLDRREHYPVTIGQVIYEVAPLDVIRLEVAVPAEERPHVEVGMNVDVRMDGEAGTPLQGEISRILPRSEIRDEKNVFVAEVVVDNPEQTLRPGMEGSVRVTGETRALGWVIGHRAWERLSTKVWW